jgi:flagellar biosynthesis protein FlhG
MHDQADKLRSLVRAATHADAGLYSSPPRKIVVSGGKGGVGTTTIAVNLTVALARQGCRALLVDADMNRADVATLCHLETRDTIEDVLSARRTVHEVLHRGPAGIQVLPGAWSVGKVPDCSPAAQERLLRELDRLGRHAEIVVLDVGSGLNHVVRRFWHAADSILLLATPDNIAIMDAYAAIKVFTADRPAAPISTLINRADPDAAAQAHARIDFACQRFLHRQVDAAGNVADDRRVAEAAELRQPFVLDSGDSEAARNVEEIAERLLSWSQATRTRSRERLSPPASAAA